ncbi:MAG: efflux RND transporter periplasmic adaptor subunit [Rhodospirillaceae bacterium]|nr:efflux RND transporter periplasmic adaptor subunit [Rhodospirillaceae bacterium]
MSRWTPMAWMLPLGALMGCDGLPFAGSALTPGAPPLEAALEVAEPRGPNGGRLLSDGDFAVELAVFETGVPPEFRAWVSEAGRPVDPESVDLRVRLTRLGNQVDEHAFRAQGDFLRGTAVVYEPHSFVVTIDAGYRGQLYQWEYESFEGRTRISPEMARAFGIQTEVAGPAVIEETIPVYGTIVPATERIREVSARFDGAIQSVSVELGEAVVEGQTLAVVESNESLQSYSITAPIAGVITERTAHAGEQTGGRRLFTIVDTSVVWADLAVFPADRARVGVGAEVTVTPATGGAPRSGTISNINVLAAANQAVTARVVLDNGDGALAPGTYVTAEIRVAEHAVPLAVRRSGLQSFRDFTVVYAQIGDEYEVRMLDLGRQAGAWAEVLGGLDPGTVYVTEGSYVLKADVEKTGATHDH